MTRAGGARGNAELHRHLDVSLRTSTLLELAQRAGLESQGTSLAAFRDKVLITSPMRDLHDVLARFQIFQKVLRDAPTLERVAFEAVEDCWREGTRHVELRFSPSFVTEHNTMRWDEVLDAFARGVARALEAYPGMSAGLICIATRDFGPDSVAETAEFYLKNRERLLAFDLAGNEVGFPCRMFEGALAPIRAAKKSAPKSTHVTIHAGEACGPENIWEAIELLGAERIGHGIRCIDDPSLMERLARDRICLEVCPTSNWLTQAVPTPAAHPARHIFLAGVPLCLNTDDPGIFGISLPEEVRLAIEFIGFLPNEVDATTDMAWNHRFSS